MRCLLFLAGAVLAFAPDLPAQWGAGGCPPVGRTGRFVTPSYRFPARAATLAAPPAPLVFRDGYPCSTACTCGCQADGPCPCKGLPAKTKASGPKGCACCKGCDCRQTLCRCSEGERCDGACRCGTAEELAADIPPLGVLTEDNPNKGLCDEWLKNRGPEAVYFGAQKVELNKSFQGFGALPDFASKARLVVVGSPEARARVRADIKANPISDAILVQYFAPDAWQVRGRDGEPAFRTDADPTLTLVKPSGRVMHSQAGYNGPSDLQALRKADPNYDPKKDPDLRGPGPVLPNIPLPNIPLPWLLAGGALLLFFFLRRKS